MPLLSFRRRAGRVHRWWDHAEQRATDAFLTCAAKADKTDDLAA